MLNAVALVNLASHHLDVLDLFTGVKVPASVNVHTIFHVKHRWFLISYDANVFATRRTAQENKSSINKHVNVHALKVLMMLIAQETNAGIELDVNVVAQIQNQKMVVADIEYGMIQNVNASVQINQKKDVQANRSKIS